MICTDTDILTHTGPLFDGLYEYYRCAMLLGREPAGPGHEARRLACPLNWQGGAVTMPCPSPGRVRAADRFARLCSALVRQLPGGLAALVAPSVVGFALINGCTFGVDLAFLTVLRSGFGWPLWLAISLSYLTAFGLSFVLNRALNFRSHVPGRTPNRPLRRGDRSQLRGDPAGCRRRAHRAGPAVPGVADHHRGLGGRVHVLRAALGGLRRTANPQTAALLNITPGVSHPMPTQGAGTVNQRVRGRPDQDPASSEVSPKRDRSRGSGVSPSLDRIAPGTTWRI
jgi:hypothetical protein